MVHIARFSTLRCLAGTLRHQLVTQSARPSVSRSMVGLATQVINLRVGVTPSRQSAQQRNPWSSLAVGSRSMVTVISPEPPEIIDPRQEAKDDDPLGLDEADEAEDDAFGKRENAPSEPDTYRVQK
jgi:hypothetical protein